MNSSVKKLTEASILTSLFIVITIVALSTGIAYGLYLDLGVPIIFALIYFRCDFKYTLLSGVSSILIILLVLGNFASAVIISQSFILGIICAYLLSLDSGVFDDLFWGSIAGVLFMVLIDILARNLIGYSFMEEVQGYINFIKKPPQEMMGVLIYFKNVNLDVMYYLLIAIFPFGMIFSIYFFSLILGKKLNLLENNAKRKYFMIRSLKSIGSFMNISRENFLIAISYIILINLIKITNIEINNVYIKTISICIEYLCYYFVIRDCHMAIGNYINIKYRNIYINDMYLLATIILLVSFFKVTTIALVIIFYIMNKKMNIRERQNNVVISHTNKIIQSIN